MRLDRTVAALHAGGPGDVAVLREAMARSPFWRAHLRARGFAPADLRTLDDLAAFPVVDRATLGAAWAELPVSFEGCAVVTSSGSTGAPIRVVKDAWDQQHPWAV